jgi:hypothetical protein
MGRWPTSWTDLESLVKKRADRQPPGGWEDLRKRVRVNFNLTLDAVGRQGVDSFDGIMPIYGPYPTARN